MCAFLFKEEMSHEKDELLIKDKTVEEIKRYGEDCLVILKSIQP